MNNLFSEAVYSTWFMNPKKCGVLPHFQYFNWLLSYKSFQFHFYSTEQHVQGFPHIVVGCLLPSHIMPISFCFGEKGNHWWVGFLATRDCFREVRLKAQKERKIQPWVNGLHFRYSHQACLLWMLLIKDPNLKTLYKIPDSEDCIFGSLLKMSPFPNNPLTVFTRVDNNFPTSER